MADMVQASEDLMSDVKEILNRRIALLHRYPKNQIKETNAAFPFLEEIGIEALTFKKFNRVNGFFKFWKSLFWLIYAPLLVFRKNYDVIYCDDSYPFYPALVKLASPNSRVVIRLGDLHLMYYYSGLIYKFLHFFEKISWKMADEIICISDEMAKYVSSEINRPVYVVLDPVNPEDFDLKDRSFPGSNLVMFHGTITKNKNLDVLLEAAKILNWVDFLVIGDGPDLNRLKKKAPRNVYFKGWVSFKDIPKYISECKIGVALRSENPGNDYVVTSPFLQYGVMGKPCIVSKRRVFGDYRFQFKSAIELAEIIEQVLKCPEEIGENIRKFINENHNAKRIADQIWYLL